MGKKVTVGYRYFMGLHFGLCYGPVDALLEIRAGDRTAWSGSQTTSGTVQITAPDLFGGEEREGGIYGSLDVMMGGASQAANGYLASKQTGGQPAYRGLLTAVFRGSTLYSWLSQSGGYIGSMNPYIKPWAFKVRRIAQGWRTAVFYSAKAAITVGSVQAMNPAHIIYQCLTDPEFGLGYPTSAIDAVSFTTAADTLHAEGFGLCIQWTRSDTIESFIQIVANHIGGVLATDRRTGLFVLKLVRGGYTVGTLPAFDESNVLALDSFQRSAGTETVNEITVTWRNPATNKDESVTMQNLASITAQGGIVTRRASYIGLPSRELAARVAQRDLLASTANLAKFRLRVNRSAYAILPGDVIRFSWAKLGIVDLPLRVGRVDYGTLTDGAITIEAVEDVFGLPTSTYVGSPVESWTAPATAPVASSYVRTYEAPYRSVYRAATDVELASFTDSTCFAIGVALRPANTVSLGFDFQTKVGGATYETRERGNFAPYGTTTAAIGPAATSVTLTAASDLSALAVGSAALLGTEIVRVTSVDPVTGVVGIARGCADTVPASWAIGTVLMGLDDFEAGDLTDYANGETVDGRFLTVSTGGTLAEGSGPVSSATMARRFARPYPPADLKLNGNRYPASITGALTVSWVARNRITQADQLLDTTAAGVTAEAGTTYTIDLYDENNVLRRTASGLTTTSYAWTTEADDSGLAVFSGSPYFTQDWAGGSTAGHTLYRGGTIAHSVASGRYRLSVTAQGDSRLDALGATLQHGALEVDIVIPSGNAVAGITYRSNPLSTRWSWNAYIDTQSQTVRLGKQNPTFILVAQPAATLTAGATVRLRVEFAGPRHRVYLNGTLMIDVTDADIQTAGEIGLQAGNGTISVDFDNFAAYSATFRLNTSVRVRVKAVRGGFDSWQVHDVTVPRV